MGGPRCSNCLCDLVCERGVIEAAEAADVEVVFTPWPYDAVARGVALLDEKVPGWRESAFLNLASLNAIASCTDSRFYGFAIPLEAIHGGDYDALMNRLNDAWREAIVGGAE